MSSDTEAPKREGTPGASLSSIPQKRAFEDGHSPAVPSPLNAEVGNDASQANRSKPSRAKKDTLKKREAKGGDSGRATPEPKVAKKKKEEATQSESGPLRYKLAPPKPQDFELPRGPVLTSQYETEACDGRTIDFLEASDHAFNKKNFRYTYCIADPLFPSMFYYRATEPEPFGPRMSFEDAATHVFFDKSAKHVTTTKGFRMARANVAVREGRWFWECKITNGVRKPKEGEAKPEGGKHVRMGWARREASLDAPVGFDAYSYGIRDVSGEKVYMSRPKEFFPAGEGIQEGDVIGMEIKLPSEHLQRKIMAGTFNPRIDHNDDNHEPTAEAANVVRDRVPIRFKAHTYFEKIEYQPTKELEDLMNPTSSSSNVEPPNPLHQVHALRTLPTSYIKIYKNGKLVGTPFEDLLSFLPPASNPLPQVGARQGFDDGMLGYYPAISVFRGGAAEVNFGPDFWYPPPAEEGISPVSDRFKEQIAEDIVYDIIDEVDFWMQDGGGATDAVAAKEKSQAVSLVPGTEEIKELVQEED